MKKQAVLGRCYTLQLGSQLALECPKLLRDELHNELHKLTLALSTCCNDCSHSTFVQHCKHIPALTFFAHRSCNSVSLNCFQINFACRLNRIFTIIIASCMDCIPRYNNHCNCNDGIVFPNIAQQVARNIALCNSVTPLVKYNLP